MKQYRPILSTAFAFLVLVSSSSFMVGVHLCAGQVRNIALFTKADGCEMEQQIPPCHRHESRPCCDDETIIHTSEDFNAPVTVSSISPVFTLDIELPPVPVSEVIPTFSVSCARFCNYDPPLRATDLTVSFQVFLV